MSKTVCVDLDGTLAHLVVPWKGALHIGDPIEGAKEFMQALKDEGYEVIIFSSRVRNEWAGNKLEHPMYEVWGAVQAWLETNQIPYDSIFDGENGDGKPYADAYIDDRAVVCAPQNSPPAITYAQALNSTLVLSGEDTKTALPKAQQLLQSIRQLGGPVHLPPQTNQSGHGGVAVDVG